MKILIVEDNQVIANNIKEYLECDEDYYVTCEHDGEKGLLRAQESHFDLIILDRMLPSIDGLSIARVLKKDPQCPPFLFLTAKDRLTDKIEGLEIGADDYLLKPFDLEELALRIKNIFARIASASLQLGQNRDVSNTGKVTLPGNIEVYIKKHQVFRDGNMLPLSPKEMAIILYLLENRGRIVSKSELLEEVWRDYGSDFDTLIVHISYIRKKLGPDIIRTVKTVGYIIGE